MSLLLMALLAVVTFWLGYGMAKLASDDSALQDEIAELSRLNKHLSFRLGQAEQKILAYKFLLTPPISGEGTQD